jgi:hypothetical protein
VFLFQADIRNLERQRLRAHVETVLVLDALQHAPPDRTIERPLAATALPAPRRLPISETLQAEICNLAGGGDLGVATQQDLEQCRP